MVLVYTVTVCKLCTWTKSNVLSTPVCNAVISGLSVAMQNRSYQSLVHLAVRETGINRANRRNGAKHEHNQTTQRRMGSRHYD